MRPRRVARRAATALIVVLAVCAVTVAAGCNEDEAGDTATPAATATAAATAASAPGADAQAGTPSADPTADTAGTIKVTWTAVSGSARQDPIGLLSDTPLVAEGSTLRARRTVPFTPNAPGATSAKGKYVYTLDLTADPGDPTSYKGTMTLDWTMTIVMPDSRNEVHTVYKGTAEATYDAAGKAVYDGLAKGSVKTSDTYRADLATPPPHKTTAWFVWGFKTPK